MGALRRQFDEFDKDGSGFLERQECVAALAKLGSKLTLQDVDKDGDNRISFEEVTKILTLRTACNDASRTQPCSNNKRAARLPSSLLSHKNLHPWHPCASVYFGHPALGDARIPDF
jgi:Ca2+-binding EF-hand superfamily protein